MINFVSQSIEPIQGFDNIQDRLRFLEKVGRVCYKSEEKITYDSHKTFLKMILDKGHETILEHWQVSFLIVTSIGVARELTRHRIASFCLSGDTVIKSMGQKQWKISELYDMQFNKSKSAFKQIKIRSVDTNTNIVIPSKIVKVFKNGIKKTYKVTTESGRVISVTDNHKIYTPNGYKTIIELNAGDSIFSNGLEALNNEEWLRQKYLKENMTRRDLAKLVGCCETILYRAFKKFGIIKPLSDRPNPHPGYGKKGMLSDTQRKDISDRMKGDKNPSWKEIKTTTGGYSELHRKGIIKGKCEFCECTDNLEYHHIDKNPTNNDISNIKILCSKHHHAWHKTGTLTVFSDKITSIEYDKEETVYDIEVANENHNFVANGIVVHNCQESTRYVNYNGNGEVVLPENIPLNEYEQSKFELQRSFDFYTQLIKSGAKPQLARDWLPLCTKTELVMTVNLRELRTILKLRLSTAAHPEMRKLANMILEHCKISIPILFDDFI